MIKTEVVKAEGGQELHLVYGEVYAPKRPDAQGEYMTAEEIRKMAHSFIRSGRLNQIDVMHDNRVVKCDVVESWIEQDGGTYLKDAWCVGVHVPDPVLWNAYKTGKLNGFSMEAMVVKEEREVELLVPPVISGMTSKSDSHQHRFYVTYDDQGKFVGGRTDIVDGHMHAIAAGTHTQEANGHTHRFSSVDDLQIG